MYKTLVALALILNVSFAALADTTMTASFGSTTAGWQVTGADSDKLGRIVAEIGDFNGDGYKDYAVAGSDTTGRNKVYVILGKQNGRASAGLDLKTATAANNFYLFTVTGNNPVTALAGGDLNNDGVDDLAIAVGAANAVYVVYGKSATSTTWTAGLTSPVTITAGSLTNDKGFEVKTVGGVVDSIAIGDFGDTTTKDLVIGMPEWVESGAKGAICVVWGRAHKASGASDTTARGNSGVDCTSGNLPASTLNQNPDTANSGANPFNVFDGQLIKGAVGDKLGQVVAAGYSWNNDAYEDIYASCAGSAKAFIIYGAANVQTSVVSADIDLSTLASKGIQITTSGNGAISAASFIGDFNGGNKVDLALGEPTGAANKGKVYVLFGQSAAITGPIDLTGTLTDTTGMSYTGKDAAGYFGTSLDGIDVNKDGVSDLIVSAPLLDSARSTAGAVGKVYVIYGAAANKGAIDLGTATLNGVTLTGVAASGFGASVTAANDLNGDGINDVVIGAPLGNKAGNTDTGIVYEVYGAQLATTTPSGSGSRLYASLLVLASFFVALMF